MSHEPLSMTEYDEQMDALEAKIAPLIVGLRTSVVVGVAVDMLMSALTAQDYCDWQEWLERLIVGLREELHWKQMH